jgi:hypothetical protein
MQAQAVTAALAVARSDIRAHGLADVTVVDTALAGSRLRIAARASIRTWFLRALGIESWLPTASSDAALWTAAPPAAATSSTAHPADAVTAPIFPPASGALPALALPEGPAGGLDTGVQRADNAPGSGPADGSPGLSGNSPGPAGGEITEGQ